ncbi:MAG: VOC family protein [Longimicrobiales bacterium]
MNADPQVPQTNRRMQPESFRARALSASITVKDIHASLVWYNEIAGFYVAQRHDRDGKLQAVVLKAGDVRVIIGQDDGAKGWDRTKGEGVSLRFTTMQNIDDVAKRIQERGGVLETEPTDMPWGARVFTLRDPDGYKLVISTDA